MWRLPDVYLSLLDFFPKYPFLRKAKEADAVRTCPKPVLGTLLVGVSWRAFRDCCDILASAG